MRWGRVFIAAASGLALAIVTAIFCGESIEIWIVDTAPAHTMTVRLAAMVLIIGIPAAILTAVIAQGRTLHETQTRCRKCGYILRGISEPRCSECGERI